MTKEIKSPEGELLPSINVYAFTYAEAKSLNEEVLWMTLKQRSVGETMAYWLQTLERLTAINYRSGMRMLEHYGYINSKISLQAFALINHEAVIDRIKKDPLRDKIWSECTRQARAACYISFTAFLSRRLRGILKKAEPNKEGSNKTFFRVHDKVKSPAMSQSQWIVFSNALSQINKRDALIAQLAVQGGKRISEVLALTTDRIDWKLGEITFVQSKTKRLHKETVITYPQNLL